MLLITSKAIYLCSFLRLPVLVYAYLLYLDLLYIINLI